MLSVTKIYLARKNKYNVLYRHISHSQSFTSESVTKATLEHRVESAKHCTHTGS